MAKKPVKQTLAKDEAKPKQPLEKQINPKAKPFKDEDTQVKWRYACPLCTNVAFKAVYPNSDVTGITCASCGRVIPPTKKENYIKL